MLIARLAYSFHLQIDGKQAQGWYIQLFDTENPTRRYSEEEQQQLENETGGVMRLDQLHARSLVFNNAYTDRDIAQHTLLKRYPLAKIVSWGTFEHAIEETLAAHAKEKRQEKVSQGWTPVDTGYACQLCGGKIYWDYNPELQHGSNAPWGQIVYTWAHCVECKTPYGQSYEIGLTYLNSNEPIPPSWFYLKDGKSYHFEPRKRDDYIW